MGRDCTFRRYINTVSLQGTKQKQASLIAAQDRSRRCVNPGIGAKRDIAVSVSWSCRSDGIWYKSSRACLEDWSVLVRLSIRSVCVVFMMFFAVPILLAFAAILSPSSAATWYFLRYNLPSSQAFLSFSGTMAIPKLPKAGTYYLWPGLQPTDDTGV